MENTTTDIRYPIGKFKFEPFTEEAKMLAIRDLTFLPNDVEFAVQNLDDFQLQTPYREGGWTPHQIVHHLADSHMNAFIRFKLALTENLPTIKPYHEELWAELADTKNVPINVSITLLHSLHRRLTTLVESISDEDFENRKVFHPEQQREMSLWFLLGLYSWHGRHHVGHIKYLKEQKGW